MDTTKVIDPKVDFMSSKIVTPGRKVVFISRTELAIKNGMAKVENIDLYVKENMAGEKFQPTAHW